MEFKSISIKNFRNFETVTVDLSNKNIFFGMNDVGKTNFLYALRYVFDKEVRKNELLDSDFYQKNTEEPIEIIPVPITDKNVIPMAVVGIIVVLIGICLFVYGNKKEK